MDEAGRTTQSPLIMAPPGLEADPDGEAADAVVDNGTMSSSRTRSGIAHVLRRVSETPVPSRTHAAGRRRARGRGSEGDQVRVPTAPLPADTIGKAKAAAADGKANGALRPTRRPLIRPRSPAETAPPQTSAAKSSSTPSFTPSVSKPAAAPAVGPSAALPPPTLGAAGRGTYCLPRRGDVVLAAVRAAPGGVGRDASVDVGAAGRQLLVLGLGSQRLIPPAPARPLPERRRAWRARWPPLGSGVLQRPGLPRRAAPRYASRPSGRRCSRSSRVEPWSVMKFSFVASVVAFIILFVAVAVLYMVLSALGVFDSLQHTVSSITVRPEHQRARTSRTGSPRR